VLPAFLIPAEARNVRLPYNAEAEQHMAPDAYRIRTLQALEQDCQIRLSKITGECELDKLIAQEQCNVKLSEIGKSAARKKMEDSFNHFTAVAYSPPHTVSAKPLF
jgi:hypothetical protein